MATLSHEQIIPAHPRLEKEDLFWLVYLLFLLIEPAARHSVRLWIECFAAICAFLPLYVVFLRYCQFRLRLLMLLGMYGLGALTFPHNGGATCFMIYAAGLLPFVVAPVPWVLLILFGGALLLMVQGALLHLSPFSWGSGALLIGAIGGSNIFYAQKRRSEHKLHRKQEEIEALAAVAERERIARDLHDVLGHTLSVIVLKAELAGRLLARAADDEEALLAARLRAQTEIGDVERTARTALAEVREAIGGYRARGLPAEIEAARSTLAAAGVSFHVEGALRPAVLSAAEETVLALALREAVTNIVRHARATVCRLELLQRDGRQRLQIRDNGERAVVREGNGLRGMRERVEALGGELLLQYEAGTQLTIDLPQRATA